MFLLHQSWFEGGKLLFCIIKAASTIAKIFCRKPVNMLKKFAYNAHRIQYFEKLIQKAFNLKDSWNVFLLISSPNRSRSPWSTVFKFVQSYDEEKVNWILHSEVLSRKVYQFINNSDFPGKLLQISNCFNFFHGRTFSYN